MSDLNAKQKKFCDEYLIDFNGARAAIAAGYSKDNAKQQAYENLTKPYLRKYIDSKLDKLADMYGADAEDLIRLLKKIAFELNGEHKTADVLKAVEMLARYNTTLTDKDAQEKEPIKIIIEDARK